MMKLKDILFYAVVPILLLIPMTLAGMAVKLDWDLTLSSYVIFLVVTALILFLEKIIPARKDWEWQKKSFMTAMKHFVTSAAFDAFAKSAALWGVLYVHEQLVQPLHLWENMPFVLAFVIANIIGELLPYLYHRISHIGNVKSAFSILLWKIHAIHHLPNSLNWFRTNWVHPVNIFLNTFLKIAPLLILGFSQEILFVVGVFHVVITYVSHANFKAKTGMLDYIIVTPRIHGFHHSKRLHEANNFGNILPFWDLVLGTYYRRKGEVQEVGVVESHLTYPEEVNFTDQMLFPFRNMEEGCCYEMKR